MIFRTQLKQDYDNRVAVDKSHVLCYSKKKLDEAHPDGSYTIVGEARSVKAAQAAAKKAKKPPRRPPVEPIGELPIGSGRSLGVHPVGTAGGLWFKKAGYVAVGAGQYVCILTSRVPFLASILGSLLTFGVALTLILTLGGPRIIHPDNPMPDEDDKSLPLEGDTSDKVVSEHGGGSVKVEYTTKAHVHLDEKKIDIYYRNPNASNHDVTVDLYVLQGDRRIKIGSSGRIVSGKGLLELKLDDSAARLTPTNDEVSYAGEYILTFYDPESGVSSYLTTTVRDIVITVSED